MSEEAVGKGGKNRMGIGQGLPTISTQGGMLAQRTYGCRAVTQPGMHTLPSEGNSE